MICIHFICCLHLRGIMICIRFYKNLYKIHNYLFELKDYINYTLDTFDNFDSQCKNLTSYQMFIDNMRENKTILNKLSEMNKPNNGLDKNIEFELLEKMKKINLNEVNNSKLALKPNELTFANILENNYGFNDINQSFNGNPTTVDNYMFKS